MDVLTEAQKRFLKALGQTRLGKEFYLTGGTALSAFYLHHRYSEDLDFFTDDPTAVPRAAPILTDLGNSLKGTVGFRRNLESFLECFFRFPGGELIEMDFALDSPYKLEERQVQAEYQITLDSFNDIAANKLAALFGRAETKDFVDVYTICLTKMPFAELLEKARRKHLGIDDYWLAQAMAQAERIESLPHMLIPLDVNMLKNFFRERIRELMRGK